MYKTLSIAFSPDEFDQLRRVAGEQCRHPRDQARRLVLESLGLAKPPPKRRATTKGNRTNHTGAIANNR